MDADTPCTCTGPGRCSRFGTIVSQNTWKACQADSEFRKRLALSLQGERPDVPARKRGSQRPATGESVATVTETPGRTPEERSNRFARKPCVHLGAPTGQTHTCKTCSSTKDVPVMRCAAHGECTRSVLVGMLPCCRICQDYRAGDDVQ